MADIHVALDERTAQALVTLLHRHLLDLHGEVSDAGLMEQVWVIHLISVLGQHGFSTTERAFLDETMRMARLALRSSIYAECTASHRLNSPGVSASSSPPSHVGKPPRHVRRNGTCDA